jgi:hypothetical protein
MRSRLPSRRTGVGHRPAVMRSYAADRPRPSSRPAVGTSRTGGSDAASSGFTFVFIGRASDGDFTKASSQRHGVREIAVKFS